MHEISNAFISYFLHLLQGDFVMGKQLFWVVSGIIVTTLLTPEPRHLPKDTTLGFPPQGPALLSQGTFVNEYSYRTCVKAAISTPTAL